jgi:RHS repeat-associated protein
VLLPHHLHAQITGVSNDQATPVPGVGHDYIKFLSETVEPSNGQLSIRIKVPAAPSRGAATPFVYVYNSAGVHHVIPDIHGQGLWATDVTPSQGSGWVGPGATITITKVTTAVNYPGLPPYTASCVYFTNYVFQDPIGARHALGLQSGQSTDPNSPNHCSQGFGGGNALLSGDGYFTGSTTAPPVDTVPETPLPVTVVDPHGTVYNCGVSGEPTFQGLSTYFLGPCAANEDRNGNNNLNPPPAINVTTTTESNQWNFSFSYLPGNNIPQSNCFGIPAGPSGQVSVYGSINLPEGKNYQFYYGDNPNPSFQNPYGLISEIDYPSGGSVKYTWGPNSLAEAVQSYDVNGLSCVFGYDMPAITHRYVSFDGVNTALEQDFSYYTTWTYANGSSGPWVANQATGTWASKRTIVVTKDCARNNFNCTGAPSFTTTYNYVSGGGLVGSQTALESSVVYGDFNGNTLLTETKGWSGDELLCELKTLNNGLISGTFFTYAPGSIVQITDKKEYDYALINSTGACYTGVPQVTAPSGVTPTRDTVTNYQSFAATPIFPAAPSILDRPSNVITYSGSSSGGTRVAETDYFYDQTSVAVVSPTAIGHDENNYGPGYNSRGNLTSVVAQCFSGACSGGNPTTKYTYDETGQVLSKTDACGNTSCGDMTGSNHTTNYSHTDRYTVLSSGQNTTYTPPCPQNLNPCSTNFFVTQITDALGHTESFTYDYNNGQLTTSTDQNSQTISYTYNDPFNRPSEMDLPPDPNNNNQRGKTTYTYNDSAPSPSVAQSVLMNTAGQYITTIRTSDGMGHVVTSVDSPDPDCTSANADSTSTTYDGLGHVFTVSNPYCTTGDPTYGKTTYLYDALGRTCAAAPPTGTPQSSCPAGAIAGDIATVYAGRATEVFDEGNGTQSVALISQTDALGRLNSVCELASAPLVGSSGSSSSSLVGQNGAPAPCGQDIAGTGFLTSYSYDALANLLGVNQGTMAPRSFAYDSLSRLASSVNPEANMEPVTPYTVVPTIYNYDANGNLASKSDPAPNQQGTATLTTTYQYDALNRLISRSYSDGTTPTATFYYDKDPQGRSYTNIVGRLFESTITSQVGGCILTMSEYDPMGRISMQWQYTPAIQTCAANYRVAYGYDLMGNQTSEFVPYWTTFTYKYNPAGRLYEVDNGSPSSSAPATFLSGATYNAAGQIVSDTLGTLENETFTYDKRLRLQAETSTLVSSGTQDYAFSLAFAPDGDVLSSNDSVNLNWNYSYDQLNRLVCSNITSNQNGSCAFPPTGTPTYTYAYDRFGNRWQQNGPAGSPYNSSFSFTGNNTVNNNRIDGSSYDSAGNLLKDAFHSYFYDAENRLIQVDGTLPYCTSNGSSGSAATACYYYDAQGHRVHRSGYTQDTCDGTGKRDYVFDLAGRVIVENNFTGGTSCRSEIYAGDRHLATAAGDTNFHHNDWLGTERMSIDYVKYNGWNPVNSCTSLPFGDGLTCTSVYGWPLHFTGKERDFESGLDNFGARFDASSMGRFTSADPKQIRAHLLDPQSFNRYTYTRNNPLAFVDPDGRDLEKAWQGFTTFMDSVKVKLSVGLGVEAKGKAGEMEAKVGAAVKLNAKTGGDVALQVTHSTEVSAAVSGPAAKIGLTPTVELPIVTVTGAPDRNVTFGGPPTGDLGISAKNQASVGEGGPTIGASKDELSVGADLGVGLVVGGEVSTTKEGLSGAGQVFSELYDTFKNALTRVAPPPPPPPPSAPPCQASQGSIPCAP